MPSIKANVRFLRRLRSDTAWRRLGADYIGLTPWEEWSILVASTGSCANQIWGRTKIWVAMDLEVGHASRGVSPVVRKHS